MANLVGVWGTPDVDVFWGVIFYNVALHILFLFSLSPSRFIYISTDHFSIGNMDVFVRNLPLVGEI